MAALQAIYKVCKGCGHIYATRNLSPINSALCPTCKTNHVAPNPDRSGQKPPPCVAGGHHWLVDSPNGKEFGQGTCKKCGITWGGFRLWEPGFSHIDISVPVDRGKLVGGLI